MVSAVIRTKILVLIIGVTGFGLYSQILNISSLISAFIPIGTLGLTKYISQYYALGKKDYINYLLIYFFKVNITIVIILSLLILFAKDFISGIIFSNTEYSALLMLFASTIGFTFLFSFLELYFKSIRVIDDYVKYVLICALFSLMVYIPFQIILGIEGAILSMGISSLVSFLIGVIYLKKKDLFPDFKINTVVVKSIKSNIFKVGFAAVVMIALQQLSFLFVRTLAINKFGSFELGLFQSVFSISNNYFALFFSVIATYSIPKLSTLKEQSECIVEVNNTLKFILLVYTPLIILCYVFRDFLLILLYSRDFLQAGNLLLFQLLGDFSKSISWVLGLWLLPFMKIKAWLLFDVIYYFNFTMIFLIFVNYFGLGVISISISYLISFLIHMMINYFYIKKGMKFGFMKGNLRLLAFSIISIIFIFSISYNSKNIGYFLVFPLILFWTFISFKKSDMKSLKELILFNLKKK